MKTPTKLFLIASIATTALIHSMDHSIKNEKLFSLFLKGLHNQTYFKKFKDCVLKHNIDLNIISKEKASLLKIALSYSHLPMIQFLLEQNTTIYTQILDTAQNNELSLLRSYLHNSHKTKYIEKNIKIKLEKQEQINSMLKRYYIKQQSDLYTLADAAEHIKTTQTKKRTHDILEEKNASKRRRGK